MSILKVAKEYNIKLAQLKVEKYNLLRSLTDSTGVFAKEFPRNSKVLDLNYKANKLMQDTSSERIFIEDIPRKIKEIEAVFVAAANSTKAEAEQSEEKMYQRGESLVGIRRKLNQIMEGFSIDSSSSVQYTAKLWNGKAPLPIKPSKGMHKSLQEAYDKAYVEWAEEWKEIVENKDSNEIVEYNNRLKAFSATTSSAFKNWLNWFYPSVGGTVSSLERIPAKERGGTPNLPPPEMITEWNTLIQRQNIAEIANYYVNLRRKNPSQSNAFLEWLKTNHSDVRKALIFYGRQEQKRKVSPQVGQPAKTVEKAPPPKTTPATPNKPKLDFEP